MRLDRSGARLTLMLILLAAMPILLRLDEYMISVVTGALLIGVVGQAWSLMARCGLISLGHAAFFGLGAYGAAVGAIAGFPMSTALLLGALLALLFSIFFVGLASRLRGAYFALATLVVGAVPKGLILNWEGLTGGAVGLFGLPSLGNKSFTGMGIDLSNNRIFEYYFLFLVICVIGLFGWWLIEKTRFGLASSAIRHDEIAASIHGVPPLYYKVIAIAASAFFTGLTGGYYALQVRYLEPHYIFSLHFSVVPMVVAIFGGMSTVFGPLVGALILGLIDELLFRKVFLATHDVLYGLTLMATILCFPRGIFAYLIQRSRNSDAA